ncbi:acyltransferase 3 [Thraustotheca clavata]|uniref:Acyltransferase 3 n=1 Tax=Thraustotheca clavata TaxID=74557 RepID=A0A1V9YFD7_9STRA|nr:acyltransferase 3 [Thraustotheca clavata]
MTAHVIAAVVPHELTIMATLREGPQAATHDDDELLQDEKLDVILKTTHHSYRPDVDGLRTLAVLPVVVFHAYPEAFPGGFIGVDIFFVISGFLISGILFKELDIGNFTYTGFYQRRVRRIFPTLILVLSTTLWMGYLYLMAAKLKALAATMLAGTLFCANLQVLALEHSYFDIDIKTNPLLHLWSLGVEEQFYIFWPFLASIVMKLPYRRAMAVQVGVLATSFLINVGFLGYRGNNKVSFYMPLSRFWQMSMGGLLAFVAKYGAASSYKSMERQEENVRTNLLVYYLARAYNHYRSNILSISGVVLILIGFATINEDRMFPGLWAVLPTVGATMVIAAGTDGVINHYVLSHPVAVYIGKISYCLYLWHWPFLVFAKERYPNVDTRPFFMAPYMMLVVSFLLSVLTYEDVEKRLRRRKSRLVTPLLVLCVAALAILALCVFKHAESYSSIEIEIAREASNEASGFTPVGLPATNETKDVPPVLPITKDVAEVLPSTPMPTTSPPVNPKVETTLAMARNGNHDSDWNNGAGGGCAANSSYILAAKLKQPFPFQDPTNTDYPELCQIMNENNENNGVLIVLGDSHADMSKARFVKLYEDAKRASKPFPTVVFKTRWGRAMLPCRPEFAQNIEMMKAIRPQAVLYVINWIQYINPGADPNRPYTDPPKCCLIEHRACKEQNMDDVRAILKTFKEEIAKLTALGIKVYVVDQSPEYYDLDPDTWINGESVKIPKVPHSRAAFRKEYAWLIDLIHSATQDANAILLDYADNYSDGDIVKFTDETGYPTMSRGNHLTTYTARVHLSILDQVVAAASLKN